MNNVVVTNSHNVEDYLEFAADHPECDLVVRVKDRVNSFGEIVAYSATPGGNKQLWEQMKAGEFAGCMYVRGLPAGNMI